MTSLTGRALAFGREVVAQRILIIAAVTAVLHLLVALHWVSLGLSEAGVKAVTGALDGLGTLVAIGVTRLAVTPVKDPQAADGTPLIPVTMRVATSPTKDTETGPAVAAPLVTGTAAPAQSEHPLPGPGKHEAPTS